MKGKGLYVNENVVPDTRYTITEEDLLDHRFVIVSAGSKKRAVLLLDEP